MSNCFDLMCPRCLSSDIDILATVWLRLTEDGTDADLSHNKNHSWSDRSYFLCDNCGKGGRVAALLEGDG